MSVLVLSISGSSVYRIKNGSLWTERVGIGETGVFLKPSEFLWNTETDEDLPNFAIYRVVIPVEFVLGEFNVGN